MIKAKDRVRTHLFVICPNNSGSTFLKNALATSRRTWNLRREGQNTFGFVGPSRIYRDPVNTHSQLLWGADPRSLALLADPARYDWARTRHAWYLQAYSRAPEEATVFVEKSPPFLLNVPALRANFPNARFVFMVRNPYAVVQSIARRHHLRAERGAPHADLAQRAARHLMTCFAFQRRNVAEHRKDGVFLSYEELCADPAAAAAKIRALVPELDDLDLDQPIPVKGLYHERPRNMNQEQIARLSATDRATASAVFRQHRALMEHFGYPILP